ncbi:MAG: ABC transporter permease subunit [Acidimicrobiales bacterium]|nr:ABC transporter permease subunit [Acidimicrobiales bacterium]MCB9371660.1 ABC transporter permease subunit [Microthrixaceae bacterium]
MSATRAAVVARRLLVDRRRALVWWCVAFVAFIEVNIVFYPSVEGQDDFDQMMEQLPESLRVLTGITEDLSLTSPVGYLQSQLFAMFFALLLLIFGIGLAANAIAGAEQDGRLEFLLVQPVRRLEVALGRWGAVVLLVSAMALAGTLSLVVTDPLVGLDEGLPALHLVAACVESLLLALVFTAVGFAVGAATGRKAEALSVASALAAVAFLLNGFGDLIDAVATARVVSPWYWYIGSDPLNEGFTLLGTVPALVTIVVLVAAGTWAFERRDLR